MKTILDYLKGKKTYLLSTALGLWAVAAEQGWVSAKTAQEVGLILGALGLSALRAGVTKGPPSP